MSFATDVKATPHLEGALRKGLGAVLATDRTCVTVGTATRLLGSVAVDAALKAPQPNAARWDYLIGQNRSGGAFLYWIEVHPASSTGNIREMEAKLNWLAEWMRTTPLSSYPRQIAWIACGQSAFNSRHPALRSLANRGLRYAGGHLTV